MIINVFYSKEYKVNNDVLKKFKKHCEDFGIDKSRYDLIEFLDTYYGLDSFETDSSIDEIILDDKEFEKEIKHD